MNGWDIRRGLFYWHLLYNGELVASALDPADLFALKAKLS